MFDNILLAYKFNDNMLSIFQSQETISLFRATLSLLCHNFENNENTDKVG